MSSTMLPSSLVRTRGALGDLASRTSESTKHAAQRAAIGIRDRAAAALSDSALCRPRRKAVSRRRIYVGIAVVGAAAVAASLYLRSRETARSTESADTSSLENTEAGQVA